VDLRHQVTVHVEVEVWLLSADDLAEVWQADLVRVFKLSVVLRVLLDRVVRQVDVLIIDII
jgi:hypothetical protein